LKMNLKISGKQLLLVFLLLLAGCRSWALSELGEAIYYGADTKVTFRIVDHHGKPIEDAKVRITLYRRSRLTGNRKTVVLHELSDENGLVKIQGKTTAKFILWVRKDGYYETGYHYALNDHPQPLLEDGRWLPWDSTVDVLLKPKLNPVSMYIKSIERKEIPLFGKPVGYDLEVADWVAPFGKGKVTDLSFTFTGYLEDYWTGGSELVVSASGPGAGIQILKKDMVSDFKSVYQAPLDGYEKQIQFYEEQTKEEGFIRRKQLEDDEYLVFRTRTKVDEDGNLVEACYGKIYPPLEFGPFQMNHEKSKGKIDFRFYFNPHGTRNLEHVWDKNLFKE